MSRAFLPWLSFLWLKWADTALTTAAIAEKAAFKENILRTVLFLSIQDLSNIECEPCHSWRFDHEEEELVKDEREESHQRFWSSSSNLSKACH